jgi:hypothetical protein
MGRTADVAYRKRWGWRSEILAIRELGERRKFLECRARIN